MLDYAATPFRLPSVKRACDGQPTCRVWAGAGPGAIDLLWLLARTGRVPADPLPHREPNPIQYNLNSNALNGKPLAVKKL